MLTFVFCFLRLEVCFDGPETERVLGITAGQKHHLNKLPVLTTALSIACL